MPGRSEARLTRAARVPAIPVDERPHDQAADGPAIWIVVEEHHERTRLAGLLREMALPHHSYGRIGDTPRESPALLLLGEPCDGAALGPTIARARRRVGADAAIIALLEDATVRRRREAYLAGADDVLQLPSVSLEVATRLRRALALRTLHRGQRPAGATRGEQAPRVLLADDDPWIHDLLANHLDHLGWRVDRCADGHAACERLATRRYELAVLDLMMPFEGGFELLDWLASHPELPRPRVMILSSAAQEEVVLRAFDKGADDFVSKPFSPKVVAARLQRLLAQP